MKLSTFLVKAKINTYATGGEGEETILDEGSKELTYSEEDFAYRDRYFGHNPFIGEEVVWQNKRVIWGMNYYGKVLSGNTKEIYRFLKEALKKVNEETPFRGPKKFQNKFTYVNKVKGDLNSFLGREEILDNGKVIYFLEYHGGTIKTK